MYAVEAEERVPSGLALTWNQLAPRTTVRPVLNGVVGSPTCSHAASSASPQGSWSPTVRMVTGPSVPRPGGSASSMVSSAVSSLR